MTKNEIIKTLENLFDDLVSASVITGKDYSKYLEFIEDLKERIEEWDLD